MAALWLKSSPIEWEGYEIEELQEFFVVQFRLGFGFAGGFVGTLLFGLALDWFGGTARLTAWVLAFSICAVACLFGSIASIFLSRDLGQERSVQ